MTVPFTFISTISVRVPTSLKAMQTAVRGCSGGGGQGVGVALTLVIPNVNVGLQVNVGPESSCVVLKYIFLYQTSYYYKIKAMQRCNLHNFCGHFSVEALVTDAK